MTVWIAKVTVYRRPLKAKQQKGNDPNLDSPTTSKSFHRRTT